MIFELAKSAAVLGYPWRSENKRASSLRLFSKTKKETLLSLTNTISLKLVRMPDANHDAIGLFVDGLSAVYLYYVNVDGGASRNKCSTVVRSII